MKIFLFLALLGLNWAQAMGKSKEVRSCNRALTQSFNAEKDAFILQTTLDDFSNEGIVISRNPQQMSKDLELLLINLNAQYAPYSFDINNQSRLLFNMAIRLMKSTSKVLPHFEELWMKFYYSPYGQENPIWLFNLFMNSKFQDSTLVSGLGLLLQESAETMNNDLFRTNKRPLTGLTRVAIDLTKLHLLQPKVTIKVIQTVLQNKYNDEDTLNSITSELLYWAKDSSRPNHGEAQELVESFRAHIEEYVVGGPTKKNLQMLKDLQAAANLWDVSVHGLTAHIL